MNPDWSDEILDSFLEEAVSGRRPPDLMARITAAWQKECAGQIPLPSRAGADQELIPPPVVLNSVSVPIKILAPAPRRTVSHAWPVLLVVAASGILVACAIQWRTGLILQENQRAQGTALAGPYSADSLPGQLPQVASSADVDAANAARNGNLQSEREKLPLDGVPFANLAPSKPTENSRAADRKFSANLLNDLQIVELIDTQLEVLWQRLKVAPAARLEEPQLAQSLSKSLTGQELPAGSWAELAEMKAAARRERVIAQAMDSQSFARRWSEQLVGGWLRGGELALDSASVKQLEQFVAGGIANGRPWNEVVASVIAGKSSAGDVLITSLAGDGNHRLASRLSGSFLDSSLGCVRCHEAKGPNIDAAAQEQYWSLVAMLMGLDALRAEPSADRQAIDNQPKVFAQNQQPSLFFDRADGTLEAAKFVLPDGRPWRDVAGAETPRAALAQWIGNSEQADQAIVNQVWQVALRRPLVASNALVDDVGLAERTELQQLLAQQFRAHGRNLSQLIGWVVRSDAFARDAIAMDRNRWLQATDEEIANWHLAEMTFAARTSLGETSANDGLANSLASALKWNQSLASGTSPSVLAQPSAAPNVNTTIPLVSDVVMPAPGYAIHRGRLSNAQLAFLDRLGASEKLSWEQRVEHVVALSPSLAVNAEVRRLSGELLKSLNDPQAVLIELMWAVQNADAS